MTEGLACGTKRSTARDGDTIITPKKWRHAADLTSGNLFGRCCAAAAVLNKYTAATRDAANAFGRSFGVAYQVCLYQYTCSFDAHFATSLCNPFLSYSVTHSLTYLLTYYITNKLTFDCYISSRARLTCGCVVGFLLRVHTRCSCLPPWYWPQQMVQRPDSNLCHLL